MSHNGGTRPHIATASGTFENPSTYSKNVNLEVHRKDGSHTIACANVAPGASATFSVSEVLVDEGERFEVRDL